MIRSKSSILKTNIHFSHVIICGHITPHSMTTFLRDFLHKDRDQAEELDIVMINRYFILFRNCDNFLFHFNSDRYRKLKWKHY